jgi:hypothetical protein
LPGISKKLALPEKIAELRKYKNQKKEKVILFPAFV